MLLVLVQCDPGFAWTVVSLSLDTVPESLTIGCEGEAVGTNRRRRKVDDSLALEPHRFTEVKMKLDCSSMMYPMLSRTTKSLRQRFNHSSTLTRPCSRNSRLVERRTRICRGF